MSYRPYAAIIAAAQAAGASSVRFEATNNSGSTIPAFSPVASDSLGQIRSVDPSIEDDALKVIGATTAAITDGSSGTVVSHGKIENIITAFSSGDYVYINKGGGLTNTLPTIGVGGFADGDFVVRVGVIVKNKTNPSQKDLVVQITLVGQL